MLKEAEPSSRESQQWGTWIFIAALVAILTAGVAYIVTHGQNPQPTVVRAAAEAPAAPVEQSHVEATPQVASGSDDAEAKQFMKTLRESDCFRHHSPMATEPPTLTTRSRFASGLNLVLEANFPQTFEAVPSGADGEYLLISTTLDHQSELQRLSRKTLGDAGSVAGLCDAGFYEIQFIIRGDNGDRSLYTKHLLTLADSYVYAKQHVVTPLE